MTRDTNLLELPRDAEFDLERLDFSFADGIASQQLRATVKRFDRKFRVSTDGGIAFTEIVVQVLDWGSGELSIDASWCSSKDGYASHELFSRLRVEFYVPEPRLKWVLDPPQQGHMRVHQDTWVVEHNAQISGYLALDTEHDYWTLSPDKIQLHFLRAIDKSGIEDDPAQYGVYYAKASFGQGSDLPEQQRFDRLERVAQRRYFRFVADGNFGKYELRGGVANVDDTKSAPSGRQPIEVLDDGLASPTGAIAYSNEKGRLVKQWEAFDKGMSGMGDDSMPNWVFWAKFFTGDGFGLFDQLVFFIGGLRTVWDNFERGDIYVTSFFQGVAQATTDILALGLWRVGYEKARKVIWSRRQGREYARWDAHSPIVGDREKQTTWLKRMIEMEQRGWDYATQRDSYRWDQVKANTQRGAWDTMITKLKAEAKKAQKEVATARPAPPERSREELQAKIWGQIQKGCGFDHMKSRSLRRYRPTDSFDALSSRVPDDHQYSERPAFYRGFAL